VLVRRALGRALSCHSSDNPVCQDLKSSLKDRTTSDYFIGEAKPSVFCSFRSAFLDRSALSKVKETSHELENDD